MLYGGWDKFRQIWHVFVAFIVHPFLWTPVKKLLWGQIPLKSVDWCRLLREGGVRTKYVSSSWSGPRPTWHAISTSYSIRNSHIVPLFTAFGFEDCQEQAESVQNQNRGTINWQNNKISGGPTESNWQSANPHWPERKLEESQPPPRSWRAPRWFWQPFISQKPPHKEEAPKMLISLGDK